MHVRRTRRRRKPGIFWRYRRVWFLLGFVVFTGVAGAIWVITQIPLPSEAPLAQTTLIYDSTGQQMAELHGVENRYPVKIDQVPAVTQAAVIAAEDRHFLEHRGVEPLSVVRATWADIRKKGATQGGSTITQQYVKNQIVGSERSLIRKLKEAVVAVKLERKYTKRQILEKYLNTVYFGRGAYGVQAAAKSYFGEPDVSHLDLKQSAYLAGLIRTPSSGDVYSDRETAYYLRTSVLRNMVKGGVISQDDADQVEKTKIESYVFAPERADTTFTNPANGSEYFVEYVRQQLVKNYGEDRVLRGGLRVYTTLDPKIQAIAYRSIYGDVLNKPDDPLGSLVSLDGDGHVVAMVGNRNWKDSQVNVAAGSDGGGGGRQAGSSFKPFVLAEAISQGINPDAKFYPGPAKIKLPGWEEEVNNYGGADFGVINVTEATVNSVNTVYAQLVQDVKPANVVRMAHSLGITSELSAVPSITLGTQDVSVLEMADAYLTFQNGGMHTDTRVITKVTEGGTVLVSDEQTGRRRAIPREVADQVKSILGQVVERGSGTAAQLPNSDVWGKTGTTEGFGDAWFVGANDKLVTAVWMGYPEGQSRPLRNVEGVTQVAGGTWPAIIFRNYMNEAAPGDGKKVVLPPADPRVLNATNGGGRTATTAPSSFSAVTQTVDEAPPTTSTTVPAEPPPTVVVSPNSGVATNPAPTDVVTPSTQPAPPLTAPTIPGTTPTTRRTTPTPTVTFPPGFP